MRNYIYTITAFFMLLEFVSCEYHESQIHFVNNSNDTLYTYIALGYYPWSSTAYPDTTLPPQDITPKGIPVLPLSKNNPMDKSILTTLETKNQRDFLAKWLPKDTLSVFFISCDTLNKYGYDVVAKENKILVRYDLSIPDLERMGYNIPYPPAPWMKEMKMYPSYDKVVNRYK